MAVRGGWRPLSGLICEIVNSVGQGNFTFVREKSGKSQGISNTYGCGNHVNGKQTRLTLIMAKVFLNVISSVFTATKAKVYKVYILTRLSLHFLLSQCRKWTALALALRKEGNKFIEIL